MVLKETMRLYPSAPIIGRRVVAADRLCGYAVPAGVDVLVVPWVIHRHPDFWPDPERFDPERFTPEREQERHRYAWLPFGGGPRACIGQRFSMLEAVLTLAVLVREFGFSATESDIPHAVFITLRPLGGVPSAVYER